MPNDRWENARAYEHFMGRWSRPLAHAFVDWLDAAPDGHWLEVGCGTGSLTRAILESARPQRVVACDTATDFVDYCAAALADERLKVVLVRPGELPSGNHAFDIVVS